MVKKIKGVTTIDEANEAILALNFMHERGWSAEKLADGNYVLVFQVANLEELDKLKRNSLIGNLATRITLTNNSYKLTISNTRIIKDLAEGEIDKIIKGEYNISSQTSSSTESSSNESTQTTSTKNIVNTLDQKPYSKDKKKSDFFTVQELQESEASGKFSHKVTIDKKHKKPQNDWYSKRVKDPMLAKYEVVAQELFRLFIDNQPKTRFVIDEIDQEYAYVNSKAVPGFIPLEKMPSRDLSNKLLSGKYKGLGGISVIALLLGESDFKIGNMGADKDNNVAKLDGGWCFGSLHDKKKITKITESTIADLPCADVGAYNWLDYIVEGQKKTPKIANLLLQNNSTFRQEVNTAILKVLLLPDALIYRFIEHYISDHNHIEKLTQFILDNKRQIHDAALQNKSFLEFMGTPQADRVIDSFDVQINNFILTGKSKLLDDKTNKFMNKLFNENKDQLIRDAFRAEEKLETQEKNEKPNLNNPFSSKSSNQFKHS